MSDVSVVLELIHRRSRHELAKLSAYIFAPAFVLLSTVLGIHGRPLAIGLERPVAISELKTELNAAGVTTARKGVALIVEPVESEYRIPLRGGSARIWSSLDASAISANSNRLSVNAEGISGKSPLLGVNGPVAVVVEGDLGHEIQVPGGFEQIENWQLPSRRSLSIVSSVLLACVFAFGMSLATGLPAARGNKHAAR
jgi:hypothetical protein